MMWPYNAKKKCIVEQNLKTQEILAFCNLIVIIAVYIYDVICLTCTVDLCVFFYLLPTSQMLLFLRKR